MTRTTDDQVRCVAWTDPVTGRVNVTFARTDPDGDVAVADDTFCQSRGLRYSHVRGPDEDEEGGEPSPVTATLSREEAAALLDALEPVLYQGTRDRDVGPVRPMSADERARYGRWMEERP